jgi:hypothetical protein
MSYVETVENQFTNAETGGRFRALIINQDSSTGLYSGDATKKNSAIMATDPYTLPACAQQLVNELIHQENPEEWFRKQPLAL